MDGLATAGMRPFLCGYAPFITARSMEQLRNDVAYAHQRVVIGAAAAAPLPFVVYNNERYTGINITAPWLKRLAGEIPARFRAAHSG